MTTTYKDEVIELPEWCMMWSAEEVEKAAKEVYEYNHTEHTKQKVEPIELPMPEKKLRHELKNEGFNNSEVEEIINLLYCSHGIDSAMQSVLERR